MASRYYESDITRLLREVASDPAVGKSQREGRSMFWDRKQDLSIVKRMQQSDVPMKGYVYDTTPPEPGQSRFPGRP